MHEMAVTQMVLEMTINKAREAGAGAVKQINLVIGDMSSVMDESVQLFFDVISRGTMAEGAVLVFKRVPIRVRCRRCAHEYHPEGERWACPLCGDRGMDIIAGDEFYMESIEVE